MLTWTAKRLEKCSDSCSTEFPNSFTLALYSGRSSTGVTVSTLGNGANKNCPLAPAGPNIGRGWTGSKRHFVSRKWEIVQERELPMSSTPPPSETTTGPTEERRYEQQAISSFFYASSSHATATSSSSASTRQRRISTTEEEPCSPQRWAVMNGGAAVPQNMQQQPAPLTNGNTMNHTSPTANQLHHHHHHHHPSTSVTPVGSSTLSKSDDTDTQSLHSTESSNMNEGGRLWKLAGEQARMQEQQNRRFPGARLAETFMEKTRSRAVPDANVVVPDHERKKIVNGTYV